MGYHIYQTLRRIYICVHYLVCVYVFMYYDKNKLFIYYCDIKIYFGGGLLFLYSKLFIWSKNNVVSTHLLICQS